MPKEIGWGSGPAGDDHGAGLDLGVVDGEGGRGPSIRQLHEQQVEGAIDRERLRHDQLAVGVPTMISESLGSTSEALVIASPDSVTTMPKATCSPPLKTLIVQRAASEQASSRTRRIARSFRPLSRSAGWNTIGCVLSAESSARRFSPSSGSVAARDSVDHVLEVTDGDVDRGGGVLEGMLGAGLVDPDEPPLEVDGRRRNHRC